jgi:hypothetical protein
VELNNPIDFILPASYVQFTGWRALTTSSPPECSTNA